MRRLSFVNGRAKRNLYVTVISLYVIISTVFIVGTQLQHRKSKRVFIENTLNETSQQLKNGVSGLYTSFTQILSLLTTNDRFLQSLSTSDPEELKETLAPFINHLVSPRDAFVAIYTSEGSEIFNSSYHNISLFKKYDIKSNSLSSQVSIGVGEDGLFYLVSQPIHANGVDANITIGIRDIECLKELTDNSLVIPFALIDSNIFAKSTYGPGYRLNRFIIRDFFSSNLVERIAKSLDFLHPTQCLEVKVEDRFIAVSDVTSSLLKDQEALTRFYVAIDYSEVQRAHSSFMAYVLIFLILFAIVIAVVTYLFYSATSKKIRMLQSNMETKLQLRTREVLDHNDQLKQIVNATANGIRIIDRNFNIISTNDSFCILTGIKSSEMQEKKCYEIFPSTSCHTTNCPIEQIIQGLSIVESKEVRFNRLGKKVVCQYRARPFMSNEGELLGIIEDFKDITDLHQAQEAVHQTQKQFESLLDSMPVGVFIRDFEGTIFYQNTFMNKVFGPYDAERRNLKNIYPNLVNRFFEEDKIVDKYGLFVGEEKLIDSNGVERTYVTHKFKFGGANNTPLIGGVSIDITKRKNAEHNSYVLTKAIVNSPIGVLITSPEGKVEFCNPEFEKYTCTTSESLLGNLFPFFQPSHHNKLQEPIQQALSGEVFQDEINIILYENIPQWYGLSIAPVFNREGKVAHLIFTFDNITQRKEFEREILIAKTKAEESDRLKTAFLSNLSHEIRTPLNAIQGFSSLLNNPAIGSDEKLEIPAYLVNHSNSLLELINDLIDIAAIESNQLVIKKTECQINNLLLDTYNESLHKNSVCKDGKIKTSIKLGVTEDSFTLLTDPDRLSQVVRHLISNAIKFTQNGFIEFGYTFKDANNLLFYVIDTGVGLTQQEQSIIFSPFRQADDSRTRNFNGMGLGLSIAKHIIERLGGKLWVNSTKGEGSTFFFTLPYIPIRTKFDAAILPPKQKDYFNWKTKTILVADDIDSNYMFIQSLLKPTGVNLVWAKNGKEAIEVVRSQKIDLVLMDIVMPEVDGFEATKQIKRINSNVKVICQTAYPTNENQLASQQSGMDSFLAKPIAAYSMLKVIDEFISRN